jgi:hypothetical protein
MANLCRHNNQVCSQCTIVTVAAERMASEINIHILFGSWDELVNSCMAFRLDDGTSDGTLYPDRSTALKFQLRPCCVFYFRHSPGGVNPFDCQIFLNINRVAYESDRVAWVDPESPDIIISDKSYRHIKGVIGRG